MLKLWKMRNVTLKEDSIVIFKKLFLSEILFQSIINIIPNHKISELIIILKSFMWQNSNPKIKHETSRKEYKDSGLKKSIFQ